MQQRLLSRKKIMSIGIMVCMIALSMEAGLIVNVTKFMANGNGDGLRAGVAVLFIIEFPYDFCLNGTQIYLHQ
jgi:hypothetical protein